jgi:hypothetical protein
MNSIIMVEVIDSIDNLLGIKLYQMLCKRRKLIQQIANRPAGNILQNDVHPVVVFRLASIQIFYDIGMVELFEHLNFVFNGSDFSGNYFRFFVRKCDVFYGNQLSSVRVQARENISISPGADLLRLLVTVTIDINIVVTLLDEIYYLGLVNVFRTVLSRPGDVFPLYYYFSFFLFFTVTHLLVSYFLRNEALRTV